MESRNGGRCRAHSSPAGVRMNRQPVAPCGSSDEVIRAAPDCRVRHHDGANAANPEVYRPARNEQSKKIMPLAHVVWHADWHAEYHWANGACIPYPVKGALKVEPWKKGPPDQATVGRTARYVTDKITNPTSDPAKTGNAVLGAANAKLFGSVPLWNLAHRSEWSPDVPAAFWK